MAQDGAYLKQELYQRIASDPRLFDFLQAAVTDGIWYWDITEPKYEWMNPRFWQVLGYDENEKPHLASSWQDIINQDDLALAVKNFEAHCQDPNHPYDQIVRYQHKQGHTVYIRCRGMAIRDENDTPIRMLGAHLDITDLITAQHELKDALADTQEALNTKSTLLSNLSHELLTPLNGIMGMTQLLDNTELDKDQREYIFHLANATNELNHCITNLLDSAATEKHHYQVAISKFNLHDVLKQALEQQCPAAAQKGLKLEFKVAQDLPSHIVSDAECLLRILNALITNAIKFTESGFVRLIARIGQHSDEVEFIIEDSGIGIKNSDLKKAFASFSQIDSSITRQYTGLGIGLALAQQLVSLLGGRIELNSKEGEGSTFKVLLPNVMPTGNPLESWQAFNKRVLVVDSNQFDQRVLARYLSAWGCHVETASNLDSAQFLIGRAEQRGTPFHFAFINTHAKQDAIDSQQERHFTMPQGGPVVAFLQDSHLTQPDTIPAQATVIEKPLTPRTLHSAMLSLCNLPLSYDVALSPQYESLSGLRVLIAEDDPITQLILSELLNKQGCEVTLISDGGKSIEMAQTRQFDLLILDIGLPNVSGFDIAKQFRNSGFKGPILAISAGYIEHDVIPVAGFDAFMQKPIIAMHLMDTLERLIHSMNKGLVNQAFDQQKMLANFANNQEWVNKVTNEYTLCCDMWYHNLYSYFNNDEQQALKALLHAIKGAASALYARPLISAIAKIEQQADIHLEDIKTVTRAMLELKAAIRAQQSKSMKVN